MSEHYAAPAAPADAPAFPADDLLRSCVHCGFCLPVCPTYRLTGDEADSPRGRLYFMRAVSEHTIPLTDNLEYHLNRCLECRACETACPAGVHFGQLMERGRAILNEQRPPAFWVRVLRRVVFGWLFTEQLRLRRAVGLLRLYQRSGLQRLVDATGLLRLLPGAMDLRHRQLPHLPVHGFRSHAEAVYTPEGEPVARVALFTGCVQDEMQGYVHAATVRVLLRYGCEVHIPREQRCCGALHAHHGEIDLARGLAFANAEAFRAAGDFDAVLNNSAGCGAAMKEAGEWFSAEDSPRRAVAQHGDLVRDITEFLADLEVPAGLQPINRRVAYDDPCHLLHAQGIASPPRRLLKRISGLELVDVPDSDDCCGAAGIYSITQPVISQQLAQEKVQKILQVQPEMVATGNPGCMMQIAGALRAAGHDIPVVHPIELLDEALGGPRAGTGSPSV